MVRLRWSVGLLLTLPVSLAAQQIAIATYFVPNKIAGPNSITTGPDQALWFTIGVPRQMPVARSPPLP